MILVGKHLQGLTTDVTYVSALTDAIIAAGWRPRQEWLMGRERLGVGPVQTCLIAYREGDSWRDVVTGLTYEQANAIVVEHNR